MTLNELAAWLMFNVGSKIDLYDGRPQATPAGNYAYLHVNAGVTLRDNVAVTDRAVHDFMIVCVGYDTTGARWAAQTVRDVLTNARPAGNHTLTEIPAGPMLTDGTPTTGGERVSITLSYQLHT